MPVLKARIGGTWVDVGGGGAGADEVWVGPNTPTDAANELWVDTDDPNMTDPDTARWNSAWGIVAVGTFVSTAISLPQGTQVQVTNNLSFTPLSGRRYRITFGLRALNGGVAASYFGVSLRNGTTAMSTLLPYQPLGGFDTIHYTWSFVGDGAAKSYNVTIASGSGTSTAYADDSLGSSFYVEDVGPVSPATAPAAPASVWTNLTLINSWTNIGGLYAPAAYRLVGDKVELRGLINRSTTPGAPTSLAAAILPAGFRPPSGLVMSGNVGGNGYGEYQTRIDVMADGTVNVYSATAAQNVHTYTSLSNISFSVTA